MTVYIAAMLTLVIDFGDKGKGDDITRCIGVLSDCLQVCAGEAMEHWRDSLIDDEVVQSYSGDCPPSGLYGLRTASTAIRPYTRLTDALGVSQVCLTVSLHHVHMPIT